MRVIDHESPQTLNTGAHPVDIPFLLTRGYNRLCFILFGPAMDTDPSANWMQEAELADLRHDLLRFVRLQLRDDAAMAEDIVQEALVAAYTNRDKFSGRAQVKTWVFSILRNKIVDYFRTNSRRPEQSLTRDDGSEAEINELFDDKGHWNKGLQPKKWCDPESSLENQQFWEIFEICLNGMNEATARVFGMRELLGLETAEICQQLDMSENNCWVVLHRARAKLRLCLEHKWIGAESC
ncbi:sigma-70 family RNA polymerase sigma factor [Solemya velum gill symbiont]|uniref:sigma-70 family RNA polymerase sigma factor n=1 Tax=Solemya velum gill symbiont TaxID=2340 RepID=UPI001E55A4B7|nr:sigma-70 family RNA polymerase sigma factor [Solemya velum gill symbiont]